MTVSALVVEDDSQVMDTIEDTLYSLGHQHVWVTNQHDARRALRTEEFRYVLLDLQIPARPNRGAASKEFRLMSECRAKTCAVFGETPARDKFVMNVFRRA